jgi:hypothetical protein
MPLDSLAGDLQTALAAPDSVVLTRTAARKYFGRDTPLGELLADVVAGRSILQQQPGRIRERRYAPYQPVAARNRIRCALCARPSIEVRDE